MVLALHFLRSALLLWAASWAHFACGSDAPCCKECVAPKVKYYSVDTPHGHCGEACMRPEHYQGFKLFEPNLTLAGNLSCKALGWPVYNSTVTHGVPPITMTLDLYDHNPAAEAVQTKVDMPKSALFDLDNTMILQPPAGKTGDAAVWIVLPGAEIDKTAYRPLAEAVQAEASMPLWVAVLGTFFAPTAVPPEVGPRIDQVLKKLEKQGLDLQKVKLFYGGHSLGSVFIQDHLKEHHGDAGPMDGKVKVLGQVLMGGFIQRKYADYPVTTLTVGGELDGLARITRLAEAFYRAKGSADFPVAVVPGLTHMQFASGEPPALVRMRDLQSEITESQAHMAIAKLVAPYFEQLCGVNGAAATLSKRLAGTAELVKPIIEAYELEGSRYFNAPAQIGGPEQSKCVKGGCPGRSFWATEAQEIISAVHGWSMNITNEYVDCSSTPLTGEEFHLPKITNDTKTRTISITTYSQAYWDDARPSWFHWKEIFDSFDTGFVATSAEEIGTKLASRQCTLILGAGKADTKFSVDDPQFCALANQNAYEWAKSHAGPATAARFEKYGQKFTFADDLAKSGGPLFLDAHLQFNEKTDASGEKVIEVAAPMQKTEIDYWERKFGHIPRPSFLPDPGCFHYCKLLSPARAMEWIYTDALRVKRGLGVSAVTAAVFI